MWREYKIYPVDDYGKRLDFTQHFYAPTLNDAFALARAQWPRAKGWTCVGSEKR